MQHYLEPCQAHTPSEARACIAHPWKADPSTGFCEKKSNSGNRVSSPEKVTFSTQPAVRPRSGDLGAFWLAFVLFLTDFNHELASTGIHTDQHMACWRTMIVHNTCHLCMQRLSALLGTHQHARVLLQCSGEQRQPPGEDVCRWSCRQHELTASAHDMIMLAAEPPLRKNGDVAARGRTLVSLEDDSSCQTDATLPEECDGAESIARVAAPIA